MLHFLGTGGRRLNTFEGWHWRTDCFVCLSCRESLIENEIITESETEKILCPECGLKKSMPWITPRKIRYGPSRTYQIDPVIIKARPFEIDRNFQNDVAAELPKSGLYHLNDSPFCDHLTNATFGLIFLALLACVTWIFVMCAYPEVIGFKVNERFVRILNNEATDDDEQNLFFDFFFYGPKEAEHVDVL